MSPKALSKSCLSFYRFLHRKLATARSAKRSLSVKLPKCPSPPPLLSSPPPVDNLSGKTLIIDIEGCLLKSNSTFPYFMLVALEGMGGFLRGLLFLFLYPVLYFLSQEMKLRVMVMVCFFGVRVNSFRLDRAVLPKYFLENVGEEGFEVLRKGIREAKRVVCVSRMMPRVMVEGFLREYLGVGEVVGREIGMVFGYFSGVLMEKEFDLKGLIEEGELVDDVVVFRGVGRSGNQHQLFSLFKEVGAVSEVEKKTWKTLPRHKYLKPLVFHDGRIAFTPTPMKTLAMFLYLPFGLSLSILRSVACGLLPYRLSIPFGALTGMKSRLVISPNPSDSKTSHVGGQLYVCNHRTLLDPIGVSAALNRPVTAVTYSLSRLSEVLSPIATARLTRDKEEDRRRMTKLLSQGDLVVCPEGTTCREPYLLRFSPLFAELTEEVAPVALSTRVSMFYGTSTSIFKFLDPFYFLMNPWPEYRMEFLPKVKTDGRSIDVANHVQSEIAEALGFELTALTRKDKYMMLAGNEGFLASTKPVKKTH